jgi:hypothetical protein
MPVKHADGKPPDGSHKDDKPPANGKGHKTPRSPAKPKVAEVPKSPAPDSPAMSMPIPETPKSPPTPSSRGTPADRCASTTFVVVLDAESPSQAEVSETLERLALCKGIMDAASYADIQRRLIAKYHENP